MFRFSKLSSSLNFIIIVFLCFTVGLMLNAFISRVFISPPIDSTIDKKVEPYTKTEVIQLNVLNACGENGLAARAKEYLRARGYDVVEIGNYSTPTPRSIVVDRMGDVSSAKKVAYAFGINDSLITSIIDSNLFVRTTVIIGEDFYDLKPYK